MKRNRGEIRELRFLFRDNSVTFDSADQPAVAGRKAILLPADLVQTASAHDEFQFAILMPVLNGAVSFFHRMEPDCESLGCGDAAFVENGFHLQTPKSLIFTTLSQIPAFFKPTFADYIKRAASKQN